MFWQGPRWSWVDPQKDIRAEIEAKDNLLASPSEIIRKQGRDPETVWRTFAADIEAMQAAGVPEEFIMATLIKGAGSPPAATNQTEENEDDQTT